MKVNIISDSLYKDFYSKVINELYEEYEKEDLDLMKNEIDKIIYDTFFEYNTKAIDHAKDIESQNILSDDELIEMWDRAIIDDEDLKIKHIKTEVDNLIDILYTDDI